jgi:electron transfer flavoprotein beta subunit
MAHIIVCIKAVMLDAPTGRRIRTSENCDLNPFDRPAVDMALRLRESLGGTVTALSMGPDSCEFAVCDAIAMGADRGILLSDRALAGSDTLATTTALSAAIQKLAPFDLVLFGMRSSDSDSGQVGPQTAVLLDIPMVTGAIFIEKTDSGLTVLRRSDGFLDTFAVSFPAAMTIHSSAGQPSDAGLPGISNAYGGHFVEKWSLKDLGLSARQVGEIGSPTRLISLTRVKRERKCEFIAGENEQQAETLMQRLLDSGLIG